MFFNKFSFNRDELESYEKGLSDRPHAFVLNKMDLPQAQVRERIVKLVLEFTVFFFILF